MTSQNKSVANETDA